LARDHPRREDQAETADGLAVAGQKCTATRTDDSPCRAAALDDGEGLCLWHSSRYRATRLANAQKAGQQSWTAHRNPRPTVELPSAEALTPTKTRELIASMLAGLLDGSIDPNTVRSTAYALMVDRTVRDSEGMEARMAELEAQLATMSRLPNSPHRSIRGRSHQSLAELLTKRDRLLGRTSNAE
jgi:hypothetical protein